MATKYHVNFRSREPRSSRPSNSISFQAAGDSAAAAVAAELGNWTTGQLTSLTKNIGGDGTAGPYPQGTRVTLSCYVKSESGKVWRVRLRNVLSTITTDDVVALFMGTTAPNVPTAMSGPCLIPGSNEACLTVTGIRFNVLP